MIILNIIKCHTHPLYIYIFFFTFPFKSIQSLIDLLSLLLYISIIFLLYLIRQNLQK